MIPRKNAQGGLLSDRPWGSQLCLRCEGPGRDLKIHLAIIEAFSNPSWLLDPDKLALFQRDWECCLKAEYIESRSYHLFFWLKVKQRNLWTSLETAQKNGFFIW